MKNPKKSANIMHMGLGAGACEGGVRAWMDTHKTPEKITVAGIIKLTEGAYGSDVFKKFFEKELVAVK